MEEVHERIIQAAAQMFAQHGYDGATTRLIAVAAQVNEVTIFRQFGNKENLFMDAVERYLLLPGLDSVLKGPLTGDTHQDLLLVARYYLAAVLKNRRAVLMVYTEAQRSIEVRRFVARSAQRQRQLLGSYLRQQVELGGVRKLPDPELAAHSFLGMLLAYALNQILLEEITSAKQVEEVAAQVVDLFIEGVGER
jgi:AcrR family transcriptional regulator